MELIRVTAVLKLHEVLLFLLLMITVHSELNNNETLKSKYIIDVYIGRSVLIHPASDFGINVEDASLCEIRIVDSDKLPYKEGTFNRIQFSCDARDISYTHFGRQLFRSDRFLAVLHYEAQANTVLQHFVIEFNVIEKPYEIVSYMAPIRTDSYTDLSAPISKQSLQFSYQRDVHVCIVSVLPQSYGLPQYGQLLNKTLLNIECEEFLTSDLRYTFNGHQTVSKHDFIPMHIQLLSNTNELVKEEYFQMEVLITPTDRNTPPKCTIDLTIQTYNMDILAPIDFLSASDKETHMDRLLFNITQPLGPGEGIIVNTDNIDEPISQFYQHEVNDLKIAYKPPGNGNTVRVPQVEFSIVDSEGLSSNPELLWFYLKPISGNAPVILRNTGLHLIEGQSRTLTSPGMLDIWVPDNHNNIKIEHKNGLRHGHLTLPAGKKYFTPEDLRLGMVVYHHDDSDSYSDNIVFEMSDGSNKIEFLFPVTIYPKDDHPPAINTNYGLETQRNGIVMITSSSLSASDIDTDDNGITFVLEPPYSTQGLIIKRQYSKPYNAQQWHFNNGFYVNIVYNFTQMDIMEGKVFYKHAGKHPNEAFVDRIRFRIIDNGSPPNQSPISEFNVRVKPLDDRPPYLYPNTQLEMEVNKIELCHFKRRNLRFKDDDTNDREIKYAIKRQPYDTYDYGPLAAGSIVHCESPNIELSHFTQAEINQQKVCYLPPMSVMGLTTRVIQFEFEVQDQSQNTLRNQIYKIIIKPADNSPPEITYAGAQLMENSEIVISSKMFNIQDTDTRIEDIIAKIKERPRHGVLYKNGVELTIGDTFTQHEVDLDKLSYKHIKTRDLRNGHENDEFSLDVSDGIHTIPVTFKLKILGTDYFHSPAIANNGTLITNLKVSENGDIVIKHDYFKGLKTNASLRDTIFSVVTHPVRGSIMLNGHGSSFFSLEDILNDKVVYHHSGDEIGQHMTTDYVKLILLSNYGIILEDRSELYAVGVIFEILPVDNSAPEIVKHHDIEVLEGYMIQIQREHVDVKDVDSYDDDITCLITDQPRTGFLENRSRKALSNEQIMGIPISAFKVENIRNGDIFYIQNVHKGIEPRNDRFHIRCTDGVNFSSEKKISIDIIPSNDEEPEVVVGELVGSEGKEIRIDGHILSVTDKDEPSDAIHVTISKNPQHGRIFRQSRDGEIGITSFDINEIKSASSIVYEHDNSETTEDQFEVVVSDGVHNVTRTMQVIIFPIDDEPPRLVTNKGLEIEKIGDVKLITSERLKANDVDSSKNNITYLIRKVPIYGSLVKTVDLNRKVNLMGGSNFTQMEVDNDLVEYVHSGKEAKVDMFSFDVTDGQNVLLNRYFYITLKGMNIMQPDVINKALKLPKGGFIVLRDDIISNTSSDNEYSVTVTPRHGHLELSDTPGATILEFTHRDLLLGKVRYVHNEQDGVTSDVFEIEISDKQSPITKTIRIAVNGADNVLPLVMFSEVRLKSGTNRRITSEELKAIDSDTSNDKIIFKVTQVPQHGNLLFNLSREVTQFSQEDIQKELISYQHDGTESFSDSFTFTVYDGENRQFLLPGSDIPSRKPQELLLEIIPLDSRGPTLKVNNGAKSLTSLGNKKGLQAELGFTLTAQNLKAVSSYSPTTSLQKVASLHFVLTVPPLHGYIRKTGKENKVITIWTQGQFFYYTKFDLFLSVKKLLFCFK